jgi:hypothetical protein
MKRFVLILGALAVSGCASITKGTDQDVVINTNPQGAKCELSREGTTLGVVDPTPGTINLDKSSENIAIKCELENYQTAQYVLESDTEAMTAGNVIFGGVVGLAIDASTGAMNKYDSNVTVVMQKAE